MNDIINIALKRKLLNTNGGRVFDLFVNKNETDKTVEILSIEISKLFVELIKLER